MNSSVIVLVCEGFVTVSNVGGRKTRFNKNRIVCVIIGFLGLKGIHINGYKEIGRRMSR